jgi:peptidoglycan/LPS O-acetylase OafA/YrhL
VKEQAISAKRHFVPGLQGLRGIAILLVILDHLLGKYAPTGLAGNVASLMHLGGIGVELFFVLSGFLITGNLLREREATGQIALGKFYVGRAYRIFPAFYTYLAVVALIAVVGWSSVDGYQIAASGLFVWNYAPGTDTGWLDHTWSLSVEEQFYLLWPLLLILLKPKKALWASIAIILVWPAVRVLSYLLSSTEGRDGLWQMFHIRADSLIIGCLLALVSHLYPNVLESITGWVTRFRLPIVAIVVLVVSAYVSRHSGPWKLSVGYSVENVALAVLVLAAMNPHNTITRVLTWRPLMLVGLISFSLYLWQQMFFVADLPKQLSWLALPFVDVVCAFAFAIASYLLVEKPFLALKARRFGRPKGRSSTS